MSQEAFADFIDEHFPDLIGEEGFPQPMAILEMARNLTINTRGTFTKQLHPTTGDINLVCRQETESTSTVVPRAFLLAIPVFIGGERWRVEARVKVRVNEGRAHIGYELHRADEIRRGAFEQVRDAARAQTSLPVFAGSPES
jgi:uncharacterized protein YfdQ (DUF2303 family)